MNKQTKTHVHTATQTQQRTPRENHLGFASPALANSEHRPRIYALSVLFQRATAGQLENRKSKVPPPEQNATRNTLQIHVMLSEKEYIDNAFKTNRRRVVCRSNDAAVPHPFSSHSSECTSVQDTTCAAHTNLFRGPLPFKTNFRRSGALYVDAVPSTFISLFVGRFSIKNEVNRSKTLDGGASQIFELKFGHDPSHGQYGTGGRTHVRTKTTSHTHSLTRK